MGERVQVGAADAAGERLHQHLAGAGLGIRERVDDDLSVSHDGGAHADRCMPPRHPAVQERRDRATTRRMADAVGQLIEILDLEELR